MGDDSMDFSALAAGWNGFALPERHANEEFQSPSFFAYMRASRA
jgi:hypothetical protein